MTGSRFRTHPLVFIIQAFLIVSLVTALLPVRGLAAQSDSAELCKDGLTELAKTAYVTAAKKFGAMAAGNTLERIDRVLDPIVAYLSHPDEEKLAAATKEVLEGIVDATLPAYGIVI